MRERSCRDGKGERSETHENRLRFELEPPDIVHPLLDLVLECQNVRRGCVSKVHDGKSMFPRDGNRSLRISLMKSCVFNEPGGWNLFFRLKFRVAGDM